MRDYNDPVYTEWRNRIYKRDGHKCQMPRCGYKRALNAHHIIRWADAPHLRFDEDNVRKNNGQNTSTDSK